MTAHFPIHKPVKSQAGNSVSKKTTKKFSRLKADSHKTYGLKPTHAVTKA